MGGGIADLGRIVLGKRTAGELRLQGAGPDGTGLDRGIEYESPEDKALRGPYETGCREGHKCVELWLQRHRVDRVVKVFMQDLYVPPVSLRQVVADLNAYYALLTDGTVLPIVGELYDAGQAECSEWAGITQIAAHTRAVFGLKQDGSVTWAGRPLGNANCNWFHGWGPITRIVTRISTQLVIGINGGTPYYETLRNTNCVGYTTTQAALWAPINSLDSVIDADVGGGGVTANACALFLHASGSVSYVGQLPNGAVAQVGGWTDIVQVTTNGNNSFGLRADGTCLATGSNTAQVNTVSAWTGMRQLLAWGDVVYGLKQNGTIVAHGNGQPLMTPFEGGGFVQISNGVGQLIARTSCNVVASCRTTDTQEIKDLTADANSLFDYCL